MPVHFNAMSNIVKRGALVLLLTILPVCHAVLVNRTIDSNLGDPVTNFMPIYRATPGSDEWDDQTCSKCNVNPDPAAAFDNTYMSSTYFFHNEPLQGINITLQFTGVSIWVFFILSNANIYGNPFVSTHCNFTLDGQRVGSFSHEPDSTTYAFMYNVPVFSQTGLSNAPHELIVSVNDFPTPTWLCFDYAIYTSQTDGNSSPSSSNTISPSTTVSSSTSTVASPASVASSGSGKHSTPSTLSSAPGNSPSTSSNPSSEPPSASTDSSSLASSNSTTTQTSKTGIIVGSIMGALGLILVLAAFALLRRRRLRERNGPAPIAFLADGSYRNDSQRGLVNGTPSLQPYTPSTSVNGNNLSSSSAVALVPASGSDRRREKEFAMRQAEIANDRSVFAPHEMQQSSGPPAVAAQEIASLHGQIQELRDRMELLQNHQQPPDGTLVLQEGQLPPPYR